MDFSRKNQDRISALGKVICLPKQEEGEAKMAEKGKWWCHVTSYHRDWRCFKIISLASWLLNYKTCLLINITKCLPFKALRPEFLSHLGLLWLFFACRSHVVNAAFASAAPTMVEGGFILGGWKRVRFEKGPSSNTYAPAIVDQYSTNHWSWLQLSAQQITSSRINKSMLSLLLKEHRS